MHLSGEDVPVQAGIFVIIEYYNGCAWIHIRIILFLAKVYNRIRINA